jgi:hypothetical protein
VRPSTEASAAELDSIAGMEIAEALRARLAAAGMEPPADERDREQMERDLAVHLIRIAELDRAAELGPEDPPYTDPTSAAENR